MVVLSQRLDAATPQAERLLVVDDEPVQRLLVRRIAERSGFLVESAAGGIEAVDCLERSEYQVVVLDLSLGREDGITVLRRIANTASPPLLVLMTGFDDRVRLAASRLASMLGIVVAGTLRKPIVPGDLTALLQRSVTASRKMATCSSGPLVTANDLSTAIGAGEIGLEYQPKVCLATGLTSGVEALARWTNPRMGSISPVYFIPLAERSGLIVEMTNLLLATALHDCAAWQAYQPGMSVAVNISPLLLDDSDLPDRIEELVEQAGLPPSALVLEITESTAVGSNLAAEILTRLRIKGVELSIDDFGTGYSSLLSLLRMPFGELKIDQSFAAGCDTDEDAWKIVLASLSLGRQFGMRVTAEGVERSGVAARLRDAGCDTAQGWLYGRSMTVPALTQWLNAR
jgi:EAL domain-containing protein (putative c-di-GMP-specific phosphodiesterase class I)/CheY-like chemotaxis protein